MNIGIFDVDSTIPNLALMKISKWHKKQGHHVDMYLPLLHETYDKVYASKIFKFSDGSALRDDMIIGGTGVDMSISLPSEIENETPDYSIYGYPHSIGFSQRGCRFKCGFCVVPKKEGSPYFNSSIDDIWTQRDSNFLVLLDNDFFGNPEWEQCIHDINRHQLKVCFSQGLNIRIISKKQAEALASVKFKNIKNTKSQVTFAWDQIEDEKVIMRGIKRVLDAGIKPWQMQFFVLIGYDSTEEEDMHRVMMLRQIGCDPFVMPFDKSDPYQRHFARWVNRRQIFKSCSWEEYRTRKGYTHGCTENSTSEPTSRIPESTLHPVEI